MTINGPNTISSSTAKSIIPIPPTSFPATQMDSASLVDLLCGRGLSLPIFQHSVGDERREEVQHQPAIDRIGFTVAKALDMIADD